MARELPMSATIQFASSLAPALTDFVAWKRCQGYDYTSRAIRLARFDRFLQVPAGTPSRSSRPGLWSSTWTVSAA